MKPLAPLFATQTDNIPNGATQDITLQVPDGTWYLKQITISLGANTTINSIHVDGVQLQETASPVDLVDAYGELISAWSSVVVNVTSADAADQETTVELRGVKQR